VQKNELIYFREILENRKKQINRNIDGVNDELSQLSKAIFKVLESLDNEVSMNKNN